MYQLLQSVRKIFQGRLYKSMGGRKIAGNERHCLSCQFQLELPLLPVRPNYRFVKNYCSPNTVIIIYLALELCQERAIKKVALPKKDVQGEVMSTVAVSVSRPLGIYYPGTKLRTNCLTPHSLAVVVQWYRMILLLYFGTHSKSSVTMESQGAMHIQRDGSSSSRIYATLKITFPPFLPLESLTTV